MSEYHQQCSCGIHETCDVCRPAKSELAPATGSAALSSVLRERQRQDSKWGEQNHDPFTYITVLGEGYGELCQAALHCRFGGPAGAELREEAVHTAAVALALVECLDRAKWSWPANPLTERNPL
jgi:hypothetical protein